MAAVVAALVPVASALPPPRPETWEPSLPEIPPPPAIPGAPEPVQAPAKPAEPPQTPAQRLAHEAEAAASPRRSNFAEQRMRDKPLVPPASVRLRQQIKLTPSEAMIVDRGAMSDSLRVQAADLRVPSGFSTIYEVDQRPDVLVRGNGAIYAVFPTGDYALAVKNRRPYVQTLVSPGTMFYIGEPDWRRLTLPGIRGINPRLRLLNAEEYQARTPAASAVDRIEPTMPYDYGMVYLEPMLMEDFPGIGPISARIDTFIDPAARAFSPANAEPMSRDETLRHPVLAGSAQATEDDGASAPRLHTDPAYRRSRLDALLDRAAQVSPAPAAR